MFKLPIRVAVTGSAGQIAYSLLFRIAKGDMLGKDQPIILQLLDIPAALPALEGVAMELQDIASPLLANIITSDDPNVAFLDAEYIILVGAMPRRPGMERKDLLEANASIFVQQGQALAHAHKNVRVLVVGNPANTNALIAIKSSALHIKPHQITAMMRLDHNRALAQISQQSKQHIDGLHHVCVWGNHSPKMYPDCTFTSYREPHAENAEHSCNLSGTSWETDIFIPTVSQRGTAVMNSRGASSAASAAAAAVDHMHDWHMGSNGKWVTMGIYLEESIYGIPAGIVFGMPCICKNGQYHIVQDLQLPTVFAERVKSSIEELQEEWTLIKDKISS